MTFWLSCTGRTTIDFKRQKRFFVCEYEKRLKSIVASRHTSGVFNAPFSGIRQWKTAKITQKGGICGAKAGAVAPTF